MFHIGLTEWILLAIIALFLIGPEKLPKATQVIGRFINELKRAVDSITTESFTKQPTDTTYSHSIKQIPKSSTIPTQSNESDLPPVENHKTTPHT